MRVLIIGGGGREHAIGWALARARSVSDILSLPGNPGLAELGECIAGSASDSDAVVTLARERRVDLVVVGPEAPLAAGLSDRLVSAGIPAFGPCQAAARIESSKIFAREFMDRHAIPSAGFVAFDDPMTAVKHLEGADFPLVVKADGLAAGKGAVVCKDRESATRAIRDMLEAHVFGEAGNRILIEEFLRGEEVSVFALCDGERVLPMLPSQDHKAVYDGDEGPNTGGMGAYVPWRHGAPEFVREVVETVLRPTVRGLAEEAAPYRGCLYAGLMATGDGPRVVEFNCRFGDPETQPLLPLLDEDLGELLLACAEGRLDDRPLAWRQDASLAVVLASGGYPGSYETGLPITGVGDAEAQDGVTVFHAGTRIVDDQLVTAGGRVLAVTATAPTLDAAREVAYAAAARIQFDGSHMRRDIGKKGLPNVRSSS